MNDQILLRNITCPNHGPCDALIADGVIRSIGPSITAAPEVTIVDCGGALLLPSFMDPHVHLDKTRYGGPRLKHAVTNSVAERAANERRLRKELNHDPYVFGSNLARGLLRMGTTHIRSHVDIDRDVGLSHVTACLRIREEFRDRMHIQLTAFPQSGILTSPGVRELMDEALSMGVDLVGGLDPALIDKDREGHLEAVFSLAAKHGAGVDMHIHEPGETGLASLKAIAAKTRQLGMRDKVTVSHAYALGQIGTPERDDVLAEMAELGIRVLTSAPGAMDFPPVDALLDAGVTYAGMSDNIQDMWSPWGDGDQLARASMLAYRSNFRADEAILRCFDMVTRHAAAALGVTGHGREWLREGAAANLTAVMAEDIVSAVLRPSPRLFTLYKGKLVG